MLNTGISLQRLATKAGVGFTPKKLFSNGEAGVWYDPSDVEASLTWRRNLFEYTEAFDNSAWSKTDVTLTANDTSAPNGTQTAYKITASASVSFAYIRQNLLLPVGKASGSYYVKAGNTSVFWIYSIGTSQYGAAYFDVSDQTTQIVAGGQSSPSNLKILDVGNGWYKISATFDITSALTQGVGIGVADAKGSTNVTSGKYGYVWGAQTELANEATEYQPIRSTFDNAFKQAFPKHTLYQDQNGGTPVTGLGQAVGLMLDKSEGVALTEKFVDTEFDVPSEWILESELSIANGELDLASSATTGGAGAYTFAPTVVGRMYRIEFEVAELSGTSIHASLCDSASGSNQQAVTPSVITTGKHTFTITATGANTTGARLRFAKGSGQTAKVLNFSMKEVSGSHATQSDSTKRPVFARHPERGRVNLLKYTEEFDNGYWTKGGATTITANYSTAPDGTQTADRMVAPYAAGTYCVRSIPVTAGTNYVFSLYARATSGTDNVILSSPQVNTDFALDTNWKRISVTWTAPVTTNIDLTIDNGASAMDILIWGAQVEEANEATGYQKVVDDYDITESGYKSVYYLQFDGVNDGMQINNLTSSSTPITALFGYSKQNMDDDFTYLLDIQWGRNVIGTGNTVNQLAIYDSTNGWQGFTTTGETQVATFKLNANDASIRKNGIEELTTSSYVINPIGGRVGLFSNNIGDSANSQGNLYQCVVRAATSTDKEIDQAEEFVAIKTGLKSEVVGLATLDLNFGANTYTARNSNGSVL